MMAPSKGSRRTKQTAMLVMFTALYIVLRFVPFSMLIGTTGGFLSVSDFLAPIYGILLGPYLGGLSVLFGSFAAIGMGRTMSFYGLDFLPDFMAAISTGFLYQHKQSTWAVVVALNAALLIIFFLNPLTSVFVFSVPFAWMHIAAFVVLLTPLSFMAAKWLQTVDYRKIAFGVAIFAFIGTMIQHLTGNILFEVVLGQVTTSIPAVAYPGIWTSVFFVYPVERLILIISAVLVGTPLVYIFNKVPFLHPRNQQSPPEPSARGCLVFCSLPRANSARTIIAAKVMN
jgi:hypothetical protein